MLTIFTAAFLFLIRTLFSIYILVLLLRVILQWVGAKFYNPVSQFVIKLTNPVVIPLRKLLPPIKGFDIALLVILVALEFIKLFIIVWIESSSIPGIIGLIIMSFADILSVVINIFFWAIIIGALLSWINPPQQYNAIIDVLQLITEPLLRPMRRIIPTISGFDISPIPVLIILQLCSIIIASPLMQIGRYLALS